MRYREPFCVYPRTLKSGKKVYYYQTYDAEGKRTPGRSTGAIRARDARVYCMKLYRAGTLGLREKRVPTMAEYAQGWWDLKTCAYLKSRMARRKITASYAMTSKSVLDARILPSFGGKRLDRITSGDIDAWMVSYMERGYAGATVNRSLTVLSIMLGEAVKRGLIEVNPCDRVEPAQEVKRRVEIFTPEEVRRVFAVGDAERLWKDELHYVANMLSATTGLRLGEVLAVKGGCVFDDYVEVAGQYTALHEYTETKTHDTRYVTIPAVVVQGMARLREVNGDGYLFSNDGGKTPVGRQGVWKHYRAALSAIGIDREEQRRRNLTFHKWRHFFNTTLRMGNVADSKVRSLTGHKSERMTDLYTHFDSRSFGDVKRIQEGIILGDLQEPVA